MSDDSTREPAPGERDWRSKGIRIVTPGERDTNTPQTMGMARTGAVTTELTGAAQLWAGTVTICAGAKTGAHHHGPLESVIFVIEGKARMRWGDRLEYAADAGPGDFIFVPPWLPHQELNASESDVLECVLMRSDQQPVVVNLDIEGVETPEEVSWVDAHHPAKAAE